jgi:hypothetical protein
MGEDLDELLAGRVYPALFERLDGAFPEFSWVRKAGGWEASRWPADFPYAANEHRGSRLWVYADRPWWIKVHGHDGLRLLDYVNGGSRPRGAEFLSAVRRLCELAGVPFPQREQTPEEVEAARQREERRGFLEAMTALCEAVLWSEAGAQALAYLRDERRLADEDVRAFRLGLLAGAEEDVMARLHERGWARPAAREQMRAWRKLWGYITVPWHDEYNRALTIYGRWPGEPPLKSDVPAWRDDRGEDPRLPKTFALPGPNSKSCPFCLGRALAAGHREVVAVEGLFDALQLQARGETRAVASVAAQLDRNQLEVLRRCRVERVFVCGDPDGGGDRGTTRNVHSLAEHGITPYVAPRLPEGVDPDEYVIANGIDAWRDLVARSRHGFRHLAERLLAEHGPRRAGDDLWADDLVQKAVGLARGLPGDRPDELTSHFLAPIAEATGRALDDLRRRVFDAPGVAGSPEGRLCTTSFAEMKMRPVRWLVPDFIPRGSLTVIAGDGGYGKSALTLHLAACLTNAAPCFGLKYEPPPVASVLLAGCEDGEEDTVLPRLAAAGAALGLVKSVGDLDQGEGERQPFTLSAAGIAALEATIRERPDTRAVIIDPVSAFVPEAIDDHKDAHARRMLRPLAEMAERTGVAVILIKHLNKSDTGNGGNLVSGSRAYVNAARAAFLVGPDPDDEDGDGRVLVFCKRNLTTRTKGLKFRAVALGRQDQDLVLGLPQAAALSAEDKEHLRTQLFRLEWLGETNVTDQDLARARRGKAEDEGRRGRVACCAEWLRGYIGEYAYPDAELLAAAAAAGFTADNLKKAKGVLRKEGALVSKPDGKGGAWWNGPHEAMRGKPAEWKRRPDPKSGEAKSGEASSSTPETPETPQSPHTCAADPVKSGESGETGESWGCTSAPPQTCATAPPADQTGLDTEVAAEHRQSAPVGDYLDALAEEARAGVAPCARRPGDGVPPGEDHQA